MSYQNPLTLTPKIYQSSDPQAPQLLGQLGDFKSIFKACLVTGYGEKQGAGYTMENETDVSCEFVSPNIMMSKIGVEEVQSYCYPIYYENGQKKRVDWGTGYIPTYELINRATGWTMLVCELGLYFVVTRNDMSTIIYLGLVKSAVNDNNQNIMSMSLGYMYPSTTSYPIGWRGRIGNHTNVSLLSDGVNLVQAGSYKNVEFFISLVSSIFVRVGGNVIAGIPNILLKNATTKHLEKRTFITEYQGRPVLSVFVLNGYYESNIESGAFGAYIYLDRWEY